jgi:hypothetical protein
MEVNILLINGKEVVIVTPPDTLGEVNIGPRTLDDPLMPEIV